MALTNGTQGSYTCPECGNGGPHNFKSEDRCTLRQLKKNDSGTIVLIDQARVFVCRQCGHEITLSG